MGKTMIILAVTGAIACATGSPSDENAAEPEVADAPQIRTSIASLGTGGHETSPSIRVRAGTIRVVHTMSGSARLEGTQLQGLDDHNRRVEYTWTEDGEHRVAISGRYRHRVLGAVVGDQIGTRLVSRITYEELADSTR